MLLLRSYMAILGHNISNSNAEYELKRIIEIDYLFSDDLIAEFINNKFNLDDKDFCWYLEFDLKQRKNRIQDSTPKFSTKSSLRQGSFPKTFSSQKHVTFSSSCVVNPPKKIRRKCI